MIALLIYINTKFFRPQIYRPNLSDDIATSEEKLEWETSLLSFEYAPGNVRLIENEFAKNQIDLESTMIPQDKMIIERGEVSYSLIDQKPHELEFQTKAETPSTVRLNVFNFPGWEVKIDGKREEIKDNNPLKLIAFDVPSGVHEIKVRFSNTPVRNFANVVSLISLMFLIYYLVGIWQTRKKI